MAQKQIAVIGGGVIGVCTAYYLAQAGHEVVVIERGGNVAEQGSFGNDGVIATDCLTPWAMPGMPKKLLSYLFKAEAPTRIKPAMNRALWRWVRLWLAECDIERYRINHERMQRIAMYSRAMLHQLRDSLQLDYEQTHGCLQLFRTQADLQLTEPALAMLKQNEVPHQLLDADAVRLIEPALANNVPLAGALHFPQDEAGNCPLFTKQLRAIAQTMDVEFHFGSTIKSIEQEGSRLSFGIDDRIFHADAIVIAAGVDSARLLAPLGIDIPMYPVKGYSATAAIKDFDQAPLSTVIDESYKVAITRLGNRVRVAGLAELGWPVSDLRESALHTLIKVGEDWFPGAANYNSANFWCGARPMLPDGPPLLGATPIKNLYINIGHGSAGWPMAAGSGKVLADIISGRVPEIDMHGLTLARYA